MAIGDRADESLAGKARAPSTEALPASAAHEINNPLDSLLNLLHLLEAEANPTPKGQHYLTLAQEEVRRISLIAREALNRHRIETIPERTNVGGLFADVLDFYKERFDASHIAVDTHYSCDGNIPVYAGPLRQVVSNLLLNAVESMPKGGKIQARVSAGHEWSGQQGQGVRVTIADNGSGIPAGVLPRIFQRFFTTKCGGNGMGLSLVKDVVQKHEGSLHVKTSTQPVRHGTVFNLFLPAA